MARGGCSLLAATQPKYLCEQQLGSQHKAVLNARARMKPQPQRAVQTHGNANNAADQKYCILLTHGIASYSRLRSHPSTTTCIARKCQGLSVAPIMGKPTPLTLASRCGSVSAPSVQGSVRRRQVPSCGLRRNKRGSRSRTRFGLSS